MTREQMEEAISETRDLLARLEEGTLEPDLEPEERTQIEVILRRILRDREAWLRGEVILATGVVANNLDAEVGRNAKSNLESVKDGAQMLTKAQAIEYLRSTKCLNHEPLRKVE